MADTPPPPSALPPAGWHADPEQPSTWRYWDGAEWTDQRAPIHTGAVAGRDPANDGTATLGWVMAILLPIVGVIVGIVLMARNDQRGGGIVLGSLAFGVLWILLVGSSSGF